MSLQTKSTILSKIKCTWEEQIQEERRDNAKSLRALEDQFEEERQSSKKAMDATKEILETKHKQEMMEQSKNMNSLLEDERKASRNAREDARLEIQKLQEEKLQVEQRMAKQQELAKKGVRRDHRRDGRSKTCCRGGQGEDCAKRMATQSSTKW